MKLTEKMKKNLAILGGAHRNRPDRCHWNAVWSETVR